MNVSKKILALLLAMLMAFSCLAVSASATDATDPEGSTGEEAVEVIDLSTDLTRPTLALNVSLKTITVKNYTKNPAITVNEGTFDLDVKISPADGVLTTYDDDDCFVFSNLAYGKTYTVTVTVIDPDATDKTEYKGSISNSVTLKNQATTPAAVVPSEITSTSIKITAVKDYKYMIVEDGADNGVWQAAKASGALVFSDLKPGTKYAISVKSPETSTYYESAAATITVTTKLTGKTGTPDYRLVDKTDSSITVTKYDDNSVEYSLNKTTWQKSNVFTGLTKDTQYTIYARYTFDAAKEDPSAISEALIVKTNTKANYEAKKKSIAFTADEGQYANGNITFTIAGDGPANMSEAIYGDTRIIPVAYTVVFGDTTIKESTPWTETKLSQSGSFTAPDYAEKVVAVKVTFQLQEKKGDTTWVDVEESFTESYDMTLGRAGDTGTKILEFFEMIFNYLFNTIPAFFAEALKSDVWGKLFSALGEIGKVMG